MFYPLNGDSALAKVIFNTSLKSTDNRIAHGRDFDVSYSAFNNLRTVSVVA